MILDLYIMKGRATMQWVACFVLYLWNPSNENASNHVLGLLGKLGFMVFGLVMQKFLNIE